MKIGFFDSGLGGLTVLKEAIKNDEIVSNDIYYLADNKHTPYGTKDEMLVKSYIEDNIKYLVTTIGCNPIVIACNTATSLCINELRQKYKEIVFIGTEPAVKVAADSHLGKRIMILATSITVRQEKLLNLIDKLDIKDAVDLIPADELVKFAENVDCNDKRDEVEEFISLLLGSYDLKLYSHIVLGCTHFPIFKENFENILKSKYPDLQIQIIDGAIGITNNLIKNINKMKQENNEKIDNSNTKSNIYILTTKPDNSFKIRAKQVLRKDDIVFKNKLH